MSDGDATGTEDVPDVDEVMCSWTLPGPEVRTIDARGGEVTVVVGANGAGKSALGFWLQQHSPGVPFRRLIAHRQLWFTSGAPEMTPAQRESYGTNLATWSQQPKSRWTDQQSQQRTSSVLFDLLSAFTNFNADFFDAAQSAEDLQELLAANATSPLDRINALLSYANLSISIGMSDRQSFDAIRSDGTRYPISQMSDGEKSALLLAANVMTAPQDCVLVIDEPERHLHRHISGPLIASIAADRPDCHLVILTHDLDLARGLPSDRTTTVVLEGVAWTDDKPSGWDVEILEAGADVPESSRIAILGGRRRVLFLEGDSHSLDLRLYSELFPEWALIPIGGCDQVVRAVAGLRDSGPLHWVTPVGLVDGDGRDGSERDSLHERGVVVLGLSEVENAYYCEVARSEVGRRQAQTLGLDPGEMTANAANAALAELGRDGVAQRLAGDVAQKSVARRLGLLSPSVDDIPSDGADISIVIDNPLADLTERFYELLAADDLEGLIREFPIRETGVRISVAKALGFRSTDDYERAVLERLRVDPAVRDSVVDVTGGPPT